ncbi:VIT1/CCC1 transporter family protein [Streptomyces sioyaensis]|uniref:VIT1/CCC1 transporter family protein n=1 Tax=Streptomyces sioyaensis TaxID=67364 RepID=UPI003713A0F6
MLLGLGYLAVTHAFALLCQLPMSDRDKDAEILALRHQPMVLERQLGKERVRVHSGRPGVPGCSAEPAATGRAAGGAPGSPSRHGSALAPQPGRTPPRGCLPAQASASMGPDWSVLAPRWDPSQRSVQGDAVAEAELAALGRTARRVAGGGIRAAVLGVNDGLVTNLCLILGMAGAHASAGTVRLSGLASLLAGALSMAAGEWVSLRGQREIADGLEDALHRAWTYSPPVVLAHMAQGMRDRGLDAETATRASWGVATAKRTTRETALRILFGVSAEEGGSPMVAAVSSLLLFAVGAFVPLLPWFFTAGGPAAATSAAVTALASLAVGAVLGIGSGRRRVAWTAARQLLIVAAASAVTYALGALGGDEVD